jgi:hypothetical protein
MPSHHLNRLSKKQIPQSARLQSDYIPSAARLGTIARGPIGSEPSDGLVRSLLPRRLSPRRRSAQFAEFGNSAVNACNFRTVVGNGFSSAARRKLGRQVSKQLDCAAPAPAREQGLFTQPSHPPRCIGDIRPPRPTRGRQKRKPLVRGYDSDSTGGAGSGAAVAAATCGIGKYAGKRARQTPKIRCATTIGRSA